MIWVAWITHFGYGGWFDLLIYVHIESYFFNFHILHQFTLYRFLVILQHIRHMLQAMTRLLFRQNGRKHFLSWSSLFSSHIPLSCFKIQSCIKIFATWYSFGTMKATYLTSVLCSLLTNSKYANFTFLLLWTIFLVYVLTHLMVWFTHPKTLANW